jgi:hypothetical protein
MTDQTPSDEQLERAAQLIGDHAARARLCAFGYEVLSRQAEGGGLFAGEKFAQQRAEAHALTREDAETPLGNLLTIVERGPERGSERALLAAAFVSGFADAAVAGSDERTARVARFVEHAEWLELRSSYRVLPLVERMLDPVLTVAVYAQLGARVLQAPAAATPAQQRSLQAGRITLLAEAKADAAQDALTRIADAKGDETAALLAAYALGRKLGADGEPAAVSVRGPAGAALRGVLTWLLRTVTGLSLLSWLARALMRLVGVRREVELTLRGSAVTLHRRLHWLGRELRNDAQLHPVGSLRLARRSARFVGVYRSLATVCFALGALVAGRLAVEAALASEPALWIWAAGLALAGGAIDLIGAAWLPGRAGRVTLEIDLGRGARGRIAQVALADADAFLAALTLELERGSKGTARGLA